MAIALTPFEALCGFRPLNEIAQHLDTYPELAALVGNEKVQHFNNTIKQDNQDQNKSVLKDVFAAIMNSSADKVKEQLAQLTERLKGKENKTVVDELVLRLDQQYPGGDIGVFSMLVMNYVTMEPGQAMFLGANEPHAYLSGGMDGKSRLWNKFVIDKDHH